MTNKNLLSTLAYHPVSFLSKLFNIVPSQWPRVLECWFVTFFFKMGAAIGWIILTAAFIGKYGILLLPILFIVNAVLTMISTVFFEQLIMRVKRELLMVMMLFAGALMIFSATFFYTTSPLLFFTFALIGESFFLAQFNIFIPILVGDRFTPLESQNTFPFVETGETIGGIVGGLIVSLLGLSLAVIGFMYIWIAILICVIAVFVITSYIHGKRLPALPVHAHTSKKYTGISELRLVLHSARKIPFLKALVTIVILQWIFMNVLEFQFTKSVEQTITNTSEATLARTTEKSPRTFHASALGTAEKQADELIKAESSASVSRPLTAEEESKLSHKLGSLKSGFHTAALIIQALIATRLISALGVVGSMLLHPIIMLMSLVGMFLKFGMTSSTITRVNFEMTNVVFKNAYFTSHYALTKEIRDQAAEFLEGIVRPFGTVIGMSMVLLLQVFLTGKDLSMWIHIFMVITMFAVLFATIRLQTKYTATTSEQLFNPLPYPEQLNAIEILAQRGHNNAPEILAQKLRDNTSEKNFPIPVKIKLLNALGEYADYNTLPDIIAALYDKSPDVRLEAAHALLKFNAVGEQFYSQAFSRYRVVETLKETFRKEKSTTVRRAMIRVFSILRQTEMVPFLLECLNDKDPITRADCIHTLGLFKDPNAAYYISPYLLDNNARVRANAIVAMWQYANYRVQLMKQIQQMIESKIVEEIKEGIYVLGEIEAPYEELLLEYLKNKKSELRLEAAFALAKNNYIQGIMYLVQHYINESDAQFDILRRFIARLPEARQKTAHHVLMQMIGQAIAQLGHDWDKSPTKEDIPRLTHLARLYELIDEHEELHVLESLIIELKAPKTHKNGIHH
ncbi:MFS transporter [Candidatus Gracilibacteria bacterium]|nr:MFS transporter [Candidatus Gracilibacteria bacterium]